MTDRSALRQYISRPGALVLPGAFDALSARIIEEVGFEAVYVTGAGYANASFAFPDIGLIGLSEVVEHVARITEAVRLPVVVDADTGYGDVLQVRRTIRELERAGAAAVQLEDQLAPKRCGHFDGQQLIPAEEMVRKISIALDTRSDDDLLIIARTDARGSEGFDAAVKRAQAYARAGADLLFIEAPQTKEELLALPGLVDVPLLANMVEGGKTPIVGADELAKAGFKIVLYANSALRASIAGVREAMEVLRKDGDTKQFADRIVGWDDRQRLIRLGVFQDIADQYTGKA